MKYPPGPKGDWFKGPLDELRSNPIQFISDNCEKFPRINHFRCFNLHFYTISDPDLIQQILQTNAKKYYKGRSFEQLRIIVGNGLLTSEGDFWRRQRRLSQPAFHREKIETFIQVMNKFTDRLLVDWQQKNGQEIDMLENMMKLTLEVVSDCMFSSDVNHIFQEVKKSMNVILEITEKRIENVFNLPFFIPTKQNNLLKKHKNNLSSIVNGIIDSRLANKNNTKVDLLDMLLQAKDEDTGERMNKKQLHDEVMTIFIAGHETTANALTWALYLLAKHPLVVQKMLEEIELVKGENEEVKMSHIPKLQYVTMVCKEVLRLYPPAWLIPRRSIAEDVLGDYTIEKGANIIISPIQMHRSPRFWDKPNEFIPERFADEKNISKFVYFPFGGGPRICIGNTFALTEMQVILPKLITKYRFTYLGKEEPTYVPQITLRPLNGLKLKIETRASH